MHSPQSDTSFHSQHLFMCNPLSKSTSQELNYALFFDDTVQQIKYEHKDGANHCHFLVLINFINMPDILSNPVSPYLLQSSETNSSNNYYKIGPKPFLPKRFRTQPIIYPLFFTYHIPSQPIRMNSMPSFFIFVIYGFAVIICSSAGKFLLVLYSKSPRARDKFKLPFMRPSSTVPPAFKTRYFQSLSSGLWSRLSSFASPLTVHITDLESPALATQIYSEVIRQTLAVQPALDSSSYFGPFYFSLISFCIFTISLFPSGVISISSILKKVYLRATSQFFF